MKKIKLNLTAEKIDIHGTRSFPGGCSLYVSGTESHHLFCIQVYT